LKKSAKLAKTFQRDQQHSIDSSEIIGPLEAKDGMIWLIDLGARDTPEKIISAISLILMDIFLYGKIFSHLDNIVHKRKKGKNHLSVKENICTLQKIFIL
jgi:hypothetical protein